MSENTTTKETKHRTWIWAIATLGLSVVIKGVIAVWGLLQADGDMDAPVPYRVFIAAITVEALVIIYLLAKILWLGTVTGLG